MNDLYDPVERYARLNSRFDRLEQRLDQLELIFTELRDSVRDWTVRLASEQQNCCVDSGQAEPKN